MKDKLRMKVKLSKFINLFGQYALSIGLFIFIWQVYVHVSGVPAYMLPSPAAVWHEFAGLFKSGEVWPHLITTSSEVFAGFILGAAGGVVLGYIFVKVDFIKSMLMPYLVFAQTAPKIALVPLFVIWFGIGMLSKVVLIISMVLFPVMMGMVLGFEVIPKDARNLMKILGASRFQVLTRMEIMYALPAVFSGLKVGVVQAVIGAIVAEWMSGKQGLGYILTYASSVYNTPLLIAGIIVTIFVGIISYEMVEFVENKALAWHESKVF